MDEIVEFDDADGKMIKLKRVSTVSPHIWQMFSPEAGKWQKINSEKALELWKSNFLNERNVIVEKINK